MRRGAGAIEVLVAARAIVGRLHELIEITVAKSIAVGRATERVGQRASAAGAAARCGFRAAITGPHQAILCVVTEILRLAAAATTCDLRLRRRLADDVAGLVIAARLVEDLPTAAAAALPLRVGFKGTQVAIVGELLLCQRRLRAGLEIDSTHLRV